MFQNEDVFSSRWFSHANAGRYDSKTQIQSRKTKHHRSESAAKQRGCQERKRQRSTMKNLWVNPHLEHTVTLPTLRMLFTHRWTGLFYQLFWPELNSQIQRTCFFLLCNTMNKNQLGAHFNLILCCFVGSNLGYFALKSTRIYLS